MTAKQYLIEINKYHRICLSLQDQIDDLRTQIGGLRAITYDKDRVQVSPSNRMEELVPKLIKLEEKYTEQLIRYRTELLKRIEQIAEMDNPEHAEVLRLRYIERDADGHVLSWHKIADRMHWSYSKVTHMHGYALQAFDQKFMQTHAR